MSSRTSEDGDQILEKSDTIHTTDFVHRNRLQAGVAKNWKTGGKNLIDNLVNPDEVRKNSIKLELIC